MKIMMRAIAIALCLAAACFANNQRAGNLVFVHATDPHLFMPAAQASDKDKKAAGERQESLNQKALADMLQRIQGFSGDQVPAFLVLTGDLGVDPCDIPMSQPTSPPPSKQCIVGVDAAKRNDEIERVSKDLGASPLKEIYLVAGNNDVANEDPGDVSLDYFNRFIDDVQKKLNDAKTGVQVHNLTACYIGTGGSSSCYADVSNGYRLIGFPSYSFKNQRGNSSNNDEQVKQFETFRSLVDQARQAGKQVIVLSHIPEIDDPYVLAQDRYDAEVPESSSDKDPKNPRSVWSTWNVSAKVLDGWRDVLQSDTVIAVLAGHLHDSHKETYRRTYTWSTTDDRRLGFQKLYLAPPLAVKNQDTSPIQARGFSLVTLQPNHVNTLLYWYNPQTGEFTSDRTADNTRQSRTWWRIPNFLQWMWQLDQSDSPLIRLGILLIALLTAFLTVVAVWNIPAPVNPLASAGTTPAGNPKDASAPVNPSPFAGDFGKTVIAGFTGLAVTEVAKAIGGDPPTSASRWFYVVHFIFFFFLLLVLLSLIRAFVEGFRAIVAIPRYSLARPPLGQNRTPAQKVFDSVSYWFRRFIHWFFSLRVPVLTGADTLINLVQGKNQTMTRVFADTIIDQQRNIIRAADAIRKDLTTLIEHQLSSAASTSLGSPVRIGISVLSADQSSVFYISQSAGSAKLPFNKRSVAWVSVFTGAILWYEHKFHDDLNAYNKIVLFDNGSDTIAGDEKTILLASHYQPRQQEDYQAFVVLPLPWPQRGFGSDYVKGAIHISFRTDEEFEQIWKSAPPAGDPPVYPSGQRMLEPFVAEQLAESTGFCRHAEICAALTNSLTVLGELLRGFNEVIYRSYIEANPRD